MLHEPLTRFLSADELAAIEAVRRAFSVDIRRTYQFWEAVVARIVGGKLTAHKCGWDVEIEVEPAPLRIEVKYSAAFQCRFRSGTRQVFKFADPLGRGGQKAVDALVLIGADHESDLHAWVLPPQALNLARSITLTSPKERRGTSTREYPLDDFACPPSQILPEVLRAARDRTVYDREHHAQTAYATRRARANTPELF